MKKIKGPVDGKILEATFDGKGKTKVSSLKSTKDLVLLSIEGNTYCTNDDEERFLELIVNKAVKTHQGQSEKDLKEGKEGKTTFLIADEVSWHNIKGLEPLTEEEILVLKEAALKKGEVYFEKNLSAFLSPLGMNVDSFNTLHGTMSMDEKIAIINEMASVQGKYFEIMRWNTWVNQNNSIEKTKAMIDVYGKEETLEKAAKKTADEHAKRHATPETRNLWDKRCYDYITEECPAIMWTAASLGYNFIIYPGEINSAFQNTKDYFIVKKHEDRIENGEIIKEQCNHNEFALHVDNPDQLINWLDVNFKRSHPKVEVSQAVSKEETSQAVLKEETFQAVPKAQKPSKAERHKHSANKHIMFTPPIDIPLQSEKQSEKEKLLSVLKSSPKSPKRREPIISGMESALVESNRKKSTPPPSSEELRAKGVTAGILDSNLPIDQKLVIFKVFLAACIPTPDSPAPDSLASDSFSQMQTQIAIEDNQTSMVAM
jgi:hypothetical protein